MTTTPIAGMIPGLVPGQAGPSTGQPGTAGSSADAFLALVQGLLDDASAQPVAAEPTPAATAPNGLAGAADLLGTVGGTAAPEDTDPTAPAVDVASTAFFDLAAAAAIVVPAFAPVAVQAEPTPAASAPALSAIAPVTAAAPASDAAPATTPVAAPATAPVAPAAAAVAPAVVATPTPVAASVATAATAPVAKSASDEKPGTASSAGSPAPDAISAPGAELPDVAVTRVDHRPASIEQGAGQAPTPAASTSVAPVTGPAPVATAAAVTAAPTDTHRVAQQVFPEVVRASTNPAGPQRVTIKLNPEALGEVRVVLTSRRGGLEVSLAAGTEARAALTDGAHELQRLLEAVGRVDSRIIIRDLLGSMPGTTVSQPAVASSGSGLPNDLAGGAGTGTGRSGGDATSDQQPRNHPTGSNGATDGAQGTTNPSRPTESVTRAHPGLDVTM